MKATARKSYGKYKPVIQHPCGRTEIVGKREVSGYWARVAGKERFGRGAAFASREDAIEYAQKQIALRADFSARKRREYEERQARYAAQSAT